MILLAFVRVWFSKNGVSGGAVYIKKSFYIAADKSLRQSSEAAHHVARQVNRNRVHTHPDKGLAAGLPFHHIDHPLRNRNGWPRCNPAQIFRPSLAW